MKRRLSLLVAVVVLTIAVGLMVDRIGGSWGQPLVSLWAWGMAGLL